MNDITEQGSRFLRDLGNAASRNPLSAALVGMGVVWLFAGRGGAQTARAILGKASDKASDTAISAKRTVSSSVDAIQSRATDMLDAASRSGQDQMHAMSEYTRSTQEQGAGQLQDVGNSLTELFRRQPLALGAIGAAIGAGIAAALPLTDTEAAHLGEASDAVKDQAGEFVAEQTARAKDLAGRVMDAAGEEARRQGLTTEGAKSAAGDLSAKVGRVIEAAKSGPSENEPSEQTEGQDTNAEATTHQDVTA